MPGEHVIRLSEKVRATIEREARKRYPEECCGGLLGREEGENRRIVVRALPGRNAQEEERERRYLLGPYEVLRMQKEAEESDLVLLGFFHSHPDHPAIPSEHDREHAWPWYSYLIVSVRDGEPDRLRSWRLRADRERFDEEGMEIPGEVSGKAGDGTPEREGETSETKNDQDREEP